MSKYIEFFSNGKMNVLPLDRLYIVLDKVFFQLGEKDLTYFDVNMETLEYVAKALKKVSK